MAFNETAVFPGCPKFGYTSSPLWSTEIGEDAGGSEARNINWSEHRRQVIVTVGPGPGGEVEVEELWDFYNAHSGEGHGFRVQDRADYKSCRASEEPSNVDQPLVLISGNDYQLTKRYSAGSLSTDKSIYKPYGTIMIASNGVTLGGGSYTLDTSTGIVTTAAGGTLTWGGQYHIPCRFDGEFPVEIINYRAKSVSFRLKELRFEEM